MSLREEMWKYEQITGESAEHVPIIKLGAFLDGYEMAIKTLKQESSEDCISRGELINELKLGYFNKDLQEGKNDPCVIDAMIDWAIRTAKRLPSVTPIYNGVKSELNPCEDVISREAVDTLVDELARAISDERCFMSRGRSTATIMQDILDLPPVTPKADVLDKIRAEIEEQKECRCFDDDDMSIYITGLNDAIDIIDKYKEESEE